MAQAFDSDKISNFDTVFSWGLAATKHAYHLFHTDAFGLSTMVEVAHGCKWWIVLRPKNVKDFGSLSNNTSFLSSFKTTSRLNDYVAEAVLLEPGYKM